MTAFQTSDHVIGLQVLLEASFLPETLCTASFRDKITCVAGNPRGSKVVPEDFQEIRAII